MVTVGHFLTNLLSKQSPESTTELSNIAKLMILHDIQGKMYD